MTAGCCSIESLSLIEGTYESEDLKHVPENLRALTVCVKGERDLRIVAARCSQLRTLDLRSDGFPYLTASCLADFFLAVGPGLEGLSMKPGVSDSFVRTVRSHCKNLYSLHLSGQECGIENSIVDLVSSYSAQLKKIRLPKMTYVQYQTVAGSCPAADFTVDCCWKTVPDATTALRDRLTGLYVVNFANRSDLSTVPKAAIRKGAKLCSRLQTLALHTFSDIEPELQALLSEPFKELHSLEVFYHFSTNEMNILARITSVRLFTYGGEYYSYGMFRKFARSKPDLETVSLDIEFRLDMNIEAMRIDVAELFAVCKSLRDLYVCVENESPEARLPGGKLRRSLRQMKGMECE